MGPSARRVPCIVLGMFLLVAVPTVAGCSCVEEPTDSRTFVGTATRTDGRGVYFDIDGEELRVRVDGRRDLLVVGERYEVTAYELRTFDDPVAFLDATNCAVPDADVTIAHADGRAIDISSSIFWSALWVIGLPAVAIAVVLTTLTFARRRVLARRDGHIVEDFGDGHFPED